ncbi:hypothetical protein DL95DRAFT_527537 [Leptodontidium sp. 2 PMI_412]|nr:hypothetical protein DL95DRAFT_527537 [Leptodontidium sp. 2 PMI_412]
MRLRSLSLLFNFLDSLINFLSITRPFKAPPSLQILPPSPSTSSPSTTAKSSNFATSNLQPPTTNMPVTIHPAPHGANAFSFPTGSNHFATSARGFLEQLSKKEDRKAKSLCATSFNNIGPESNILPTKNGFIDAAFRAYNQHHHLEIRPDDI